MRLVHCGVGVVLDAGRRFKGDVAVRARSLVVDAAEDVGGTPQVIARDANEGVVGALRSILRSLPQCVVVVRRAGDRLLEDRRVGGEARDPALAHVALELPGVEHLAVNEVEPDALAALP